jgi:hypothetical protein
MTIEREREREREREYEFSKHAIVVREGLRKSEEYNDVVRGVRGESALEEVVENKSAASLHLVLHENNSTA